MSYKCAIFDMDGTVLNTLGDLADGINYAMKEGGHRHDYSEQEAAMFVGSGILVAFERALALEAGTSHDELEAIGTGVDLAPFGVDAAEAERLQAIFKPYYAERCTIRTAPYPGITELLQELKEKGLSTAVVSNKPDYAVQTITPKYFPGLFDLAVGERPSVRRKPFPDMTEAGLKQLGVSKKDAVYIGDSEIDIQTAKNTDIDCICVSWGFRSRSFLLRHGAGTIVDSTEELLGKLV